MLKPPKSRKSIRLKDYDYSMSGGYFVTICVQEMKCVMGEIAGGDMQLNGFGKIVEQIWEELPNRFPTIELDVFVVMPNHFHGIVFLQNPGAASSTPTTLGKVIRAFKSISAIEVNRRLETQGKQFWQRNFFERVIRNEKEMDKIREYIINNPLQWEIDRNCPENLGTIFESNS